MSMWLQTRNVRHLVTGGPLRTICGGTPGMWFDTKPGRGRFVFDGANSSAPVDLTLPLCRRCTRNLADLNRAAR